MQFKPSDNLKSKTFIGLLLAQFLAAFNDQAIHASAMFYAISKNSMSEAVAISLMPILFFAPWAIFCTLAGYLADRFSKRQSLVFWKLAEIGITLVALTGFWLGSGPVHSELGPYIVLFTVFLMGTHSAFFVPAKYGAMPEILQPHLLSKGNGLLESLSFLAVILGTVTGGILSSEYVFKGREYYIGLVLVALAVVGAIASLLIRKMPAANPERPFPTNLFKPLFTNLKLLLRSRPLALAMLGIAFFTFVVAFMRASVYMLGESHVPHWSEFKTSIIVGMSALGIGLGSPLAGWLSGSKVELGLVPLGAVGMILAAIAAAFTLHWLPGLIVCIIVIGFFTGFFTLPLFTLLQHRAPKASKGDTIATSNFINVVGAMAASVLFFVLVFAAQQLGVAPKVPQRDLFAGELKDLKLNHHGRPAYFRLEGPGGQVEVAEHGRLNRPDEEDESDQRRIEVDEDLISIFGRVDIGAPVIVSTYVLPPTKHRAQVLTYYRIRLANQPMKDAFDNESLPRYLFLGAALMTLGVLILLCRVLPDFFVRSLLWLRAQGRSRLKVVGLQNLPAEGPVLLATNCDRFKDCMQVVTATDRFTRFILFEDPTDREPTPLLRYLARRTGLVALRMDTVKPEDWEKAFVRAARALDEGKLVAITADGSGPQSKKEEFLDRLRARNPVAVLPVYCGTVEAEPETNGGMFALKHVRVVIGEPVRPAATAADIRRAIHALGEEKMVSDHFSPQEDKVQG